MATLVLTAIGTAVGGPIGGAIGALVGGVVDQELLFRPKGREGPRLKELDVQTSRYGAHVPRLFGTMRVAGQVVWATDLKEARAREGGGKGQPSLTTYSYSASFAVLLSARPILEVRRIWADGSLLRGAAGDWKAQTGFRLHHGSEGQAPDPLIAAIEGAAPALRGCAYAVFEDLALEGFGNRIPSLTFEVVADAAPVALGRVIADVSGGRAASAIPVTVDGYAATGDSIAAAIAPLATIAPIAWRCDAAGLRAVVADAADATLLRPLGSDGAGERQPRIERSRAAIETVPQRVSVVHYDPARDFQTGAQAARHGGPGRIETRVELPAALTAAAARGAAEAVLGEGLAARERVTLRMPWTPGLIRPGDAARIAGLDGVWRVRDVAIERMVATITLSRMPGAVQSPLPAADGGRPALATDIPAGPTRLIVMEAPPGETIATVPQLIVAAGGGAGWRGASVSVADEAAHGWTPVAAGARGTVTGIVEVAAAPDASPALVDHRSRLVVRLDDVGAMLSDADAAAIDAGGNAALVGEELIQFARAQPLGGGRWRLSGLRRGCRASEAAMAGAAGGASFALVERLRPIARPGTPGDGVRALARGVGDADGVEATAVLSGRSLLPPAPVHLRLERAGGAAVLRWVRRSRIGWRWADGTDAPLGEEREAYRVLTIAADGAATVTEVPQPWLALADGVSPQRVEVRQLGTHGVSPAVVLEPD